MAGRSDLMMPRRRPRKRQRPTTVTGRVPGQLARHRSSGQRQLASTESRGNAGAGFRAADGHRGSRMAEEGVVDFAITGVGRCGALEETVGWTCAQPVPSTVSAEESSSVR